MEVVRPPVVFKIGGSVLTYPKRAEEVMLGLSRRPDWKEEGARSPIVVVSALGKLFPGDPGFSDKPDGLYNKKITDLLIFASEGDIQALDHASKRLEKFGRAFGVNNVINWIGDIHTGISQGQTKEWIISRGEWITTQTMAEGFGGTFVDAANLLIVDEKGNINPQSYVRIKTGLSGNRDNKVVWVPGFYGVDVGGNIQLLPRGGSDTTAACIAYAVAARKYVNLKDVPGVQAADPRLFERPSVIPTIPELTFREMKVLAHMGVDVLHENALEFLRQPDRMIPTFILSAYAPQLQGTELVSERDLSGDPVIAVVGNVKGDSGLVCVVGDGIEYHSDEVFGRFSQALQSLGINIETTKYERNTNHIIVKLPKDIVEGAIKKLFDTFFPTNKLYT